MKNDIVRKKDPSPKTVTEACHIVSKWKNQHGGKYNKSNDDIAFATVTEEKEKKKSKKKREITCFRCKKTGHFQMSVKRNCPRNLAIRNELT